MKKMKICIDAGHYGKYNRSPANLNYYEAEVMWVLHNMLADELEKLGVSVVRTRARQTHDLALEKRGRSAIGCDLFISLHSNAVGSGITESVDYPLACVFSPDNSTKIDETSAEFGLKIAKVVADVMDTKQPAQILRKKSSLDRDGDGILNDEWYGVLQGAKSVGVPAVLLEHSFHTQTRATNWLLEPKNLRKLAIAEADCIYNYFKNVTRSETASFLIRVIDPDPCGLNVHKYASIAAPILSSVRKGEVLTIVETAIVGKAVWGRLKSGAGWISLGTKYVERL